VDFKHPNPALSEHLIETVRIWAELGVDGFRGDVASLLPLDFWPRAREAIAEVKSDVIWLAESVQAGGSQLFRRDGGLWVGAARPATGATTSSSPARA
jgi:glycosidase